MMQSTSLIHYTSYSNNCYFYLPPIVAENTGQVIIKVILRKKGKIHSNPSIH